MKIKNKQNKTKNEMKKERQKERKKNKLQKSYSNNKKIKQKSVKYL